MSMESSMVMTSMPVEPEMINMVLEKMDEVAALLDSTTKDY